MTQIARIAVFRFARFDITDFARASYFMLEAAIFNLNSLNF